MNLAVDYVSDPGNPHYTLRVYKKDPHKAGKDHSWLNAYYPENNENGYLEVNMKDPTGLDYTPVNPPDYNSVLYTAFAAYLKRQVETGQLDEDKYEEIYKAAFP